MFQKVIRIGNSAGVVIPEEAMEVLGLKVDDRVEVRVDLARKALYIEPVSRAGRSRSKYS